MFYISSEYFISFTHSKVPMPNKKISISSIFQILIPSYSDGQNVNNKLYLSKNMADNILIAKGIIIVRNSFFTKVDIPKAKTEKTAPHTKTITTVIIIYAITLCSASSV